MVDISLEAEPIKILSEDLILVDWGPMTLTVSAWLAGEACPVIAARAARKSIFCLTALSEYRTFLEKHTAHLPNMDRLPAIVKHAWCAARAITPDLTPMAAVAGAVSDMVADTAQTLSADRVIVNNGGDIAVRLGASQSVVVGLKAWNSDELVAQLEIQTKSGIGGVASSGWHGRSFSPGVADLVTVWAATATLADAAATIIAAKAQVEAEEISRRRACDLDPDSDLGCLQVTTSVGLLSERQKKIALDAAIEEAKRLYQMGQILGCYITVQELTGILNPDGYLDVKTTAQ